MRIVMAHNDYGAPSGEEVQFEHVHRLLVEHGHEVQLLRRSSAELTQMTLGKVRALVSGIYNPDSRQRMVRLLNDFRPDVVLLQNLFPLLSPSILPACGEAGVPAVMMVANYRLMCPNGLHMSHGQTCEKCLGGREYNCVLNNCEGNLFKSTGYAIRSTVARVAGWYKKNVGAYVCASQFLRRRMIAAGYDQQKIHLIPNVVPAVENLSTIPANQTSYVGYVGRISREKGIHTILAAAKLLPNIRFRLAGRVAGDVTLPDPLPANVELVGFLSREQLNDFYAGARMILSASECFETFGMSVGEALQRANAVVVSRIGVFPEFVHDGVTGLLFEPGDAHELSEKISHLWERPDLCEQMGRAGRAWARREYTPQMYYSRLMNVCKGLVGEPASVS